MKRIAIIATVVAIIVAIVVIVLVLGEPNLEQPNYNLENGFGYCDDEIRGGGLMRTESITFWTPSLDSNFTLDLECYIIAGVRPTAYQSFWSDQDIHSIYEVVRAQANAEVVREGYIVISANAPGFRYVMIAERPLPQGEHEYNAFNALGQRFVFMPLQGRFFDQDVIAQSFWQIQGNHFVVDVPYHLFDDPLLFYVTGAYDLSLEGVVGNFDLSHQIGHYYGIYGSMADFRAFYESLGLYEIAETEDQLILTSSAHTMTLSFQEEDGQRVVAFSFE